MRRTVVSLGRSPFSRMTPVPLTTRNASVCISAKAVGALTMGTRHFSTRNARATKTTTRPTFYVPGTGDAEALRRSKAQHVTDSALEAQLAYRHYAEQLNLCADDELLAGMRQAHDSVGAVVGRLTATESEPSKEMIKSYQQLLQSGMKKKEISAVLQTWHAETTLAEGRQILAEAFRPESEWDLSNVTPKAVATEDGDSSTETEKAQGAKRIKTSPVDSTDQSFSSKLAASLLLSRSKNEKQTKIKEAFAAMKSEADIFVAGLTSILPMNPAMAEDLLMLWAGYRLGLTNVMCLAGPNDFVASVNMVGFIDLLNGKIYGEDTLRREFNLEMKITDALKHKVSAAHEEKEEKEETSSEPRKRAFFNAAKRGTQNENDAAQDRTASAPSSASAATRAAGSTDHEHDTAVRFFKFSLHDIPLDARFALFASLHVHVPKERYPALFGAHLARERVGDLLNRAGFFFLGHRLTILDSPLAVRVLGVVPQRPEGYEVGHGVVEKLMVMYMAPSGQWVLSDLVPIRAIADSQVEGATPDAAAAPVKQSAKERGLLVVGVIALTFFSLLPAVMFLLWVYATYVLFKAILKFLSPS